MTGISGEEDEANDKARGLVNNDNAWCWREGCKGEGALFYISCVLTRHNTRLSQNDQSDTEDFGDAAECC